MHFFSFKITVKFIKEPVPLQKNVINIIFLEWDRLGFGCRERYWWDYLLISSRLRWISSSERL